MVPVAGLEPARGKSPKDFKSVVSTNFTTPAIPAQFVSVCASLYQSVSNLKHHTVRYRTLQGGKEVIFALFSPISPFQCLSGILYRLFLPVLPFVGSYWLLAPVPPTASGVSFEHRLVLAVCLYPPTEFALVDHSVLVLAALSVVAARSALVTMPAFSVIVIPALVLFTRRHRPECSTSGPPTSVICGVVTPSFEASIVPRCILGGLEILAPKRSTHSVSPCNLPNVLAWEPPFDIV